MKKCILLFAVLLLSWQTGNALVVSVDGQGEISETGMELTITEAEIDPFTETPLMSLNGSMLSTGSLRVTITRSAANLTDEFCCAGQCNPGDSTTRQELTFSPQGVTSWFVHYTPAEKSYETIVYFFKDDETSLTLTVHYAYGVEPRPTAFPKKHLIEEFTGQACGYCPYGMDCIHNFIANDTNWVLILHHYGYSQDNFSVSGSNTITSKLGVNGAPSIAINRQTTNYGDGKGIVFHPGYLEETDKSQFATETYASIHIDNSYDTVTRALNVKVSGLVLDATKKNLKLTVLVKESGMIDYQADYYNTFEGWQEFRHTNAVRLFFTGSTGTAITIDSTQHYEVELTKTLDSKWVPENCMVVAFLSEDFKPTVQAEQKPVVAGTQGGADIMHGGVKPYPVADYYPEPSATAKPSDYSREKSETLNYAYAEYKAYPNYGFNFWQIMAYNTSRTVKVNNTNCVPFTYLYLFTELNEKGLPNGTYTFDTSSLPGTAYAGFRDDENFVIDGSIFYFTNLSYFNQGYLVPEAEWLIASGTLVISDTGWSVNGHALNGSAVNLVGTTPINYNGREEGVEETKTNTIPHKQIKNGQLIIERQGQRFNSIGQPIQ